MVYAKNEKKGSYCGFFHHISPTNTFNHVDFIAANALPGPESLIHCTLQKQGKFGVTEYCSYLKKSRLAQVPGLIYGGGDLLNLKRPAQWNDRKLTETDLQGIDIQKHKGWLIYRGSDNSLVNAPTKNNPLWVNLKTYINESDFRKLRDINNEPAWVKDLMKDKDWRFKVQRLLAKKRLTESVANVDNQINTIGTPPLSDE